MLLLSRAEHLEAAAGRGLECKILVKRQGLSPIPKPLMTKDFNEVIKITSLLWRFAIKSRIFKITR